MQKNNIQKSKTQVTKTLNPNIKLSNSQRAELLNDALNWRYAVREFDQQQVPNEIVDQLVNATSLTASSYGLQPYKILVIKSKPARYSLLEHSMGQDKVSNCSHLIVLAAKTNVSEQLVIDYVEKFSTTRNVPLSKLHGMTEHFKGALSNMNEAAKLQWAQQQVYIALGNLLTSAALLEIDACPMGGFDTAGFDEVLKLTEQNLTATVICPIGYRSPYDQEANAAKVRFPQEQLVAVL
ncbi:MAG: NAD(P)H-dependent oxidoreductase [Kangiellaceae bacterium]|nr:NAD(P)H-dependent oxidoreductase [Kangiellaceae bacterium]